MNWVFAGHSYRLSFRFVRLSRHAKTNQWSSEFHPITFLSSHRLAIPAFHRHVHLHLSASAIEFLIVDTSAEDIARSLFGESVGRWAWVERVVRHKAVAHSGTAVAPKTALVAAEPPQPSIRPKLYEARITSEPTDGW